MNQKGFKHITWNMRMTIERMLKVHCTQQKIADALGVCLRSLQYELARGKCTQLTSELEYVERYCPEVAERNYQANLRAKGPDLKIGNDHALAARIENLILEQKFSPGAALAEIRNQGEQYHTQISETTLYNYIYRGDVFLKLTAEALHEKGRRHTAKKTPPIAARAPKGQSIEKRPEEIQERTTFGHWEMDSVIGCKGSSKTLLVLTERLTRQGLVALLPDHTSASVVRALDSLERRFDKDFPKIFKSITVDNGCEFQDCQGMEASHCREGARTRIYYCHPYCACERGSNENLNRLYRRFFPKGTSLDDITAEQIQQAESWINNYPRRLLGWKSSAMLFEEYLRKLE